MNFLDRNELQNTPIAFRLVDEGSVTKAEVIKLFLQANRGVPQQPEHLEKIQQLYNQEVAKNGRK